MAESQLHAGYVYVCECVSVYVCVCERGGGGESNDRGINEMNATFFHRLHLQLKHNFCASLFQLFSKYKYLNLYIILKLLQFLNKNL